MLQEGLLNWLQKPQLLPESSASGSGSMSLHMEATGQVAEKDSIEAGLSAHQLFQMPHPYLAIPILSPCPISYAMERDTVTNQPTANCQHGTVWRRTGNMMVVRALLSMWGGALRDEQINEPSRTQLSSLTGNSQDKSPEVSRET